MHIHNFPVTAPQQHIGRQTPLLPGSETTSRHPALGHEVPSDQHPDYHPPEEASNNSVQASHYAERSVAPLPVKDLSHEIHAEYQSEKPSHEPVFSVVPQYVRGEEHVRAYIQQQPVQEHSHHDLQPPPVQEPSVPTEPAHPFEQNDSRTTRAPAPIGTQRAPSPQPASQEEPIFEAPKAEWDASR
jgi:glycogenin glucosyltransferase